MNKPSLNHVQFWALGYWIEMDRRIQIQDKHDELEEQAFNLHPERWGQLYRHQVLPGVPGINPGDRGSAFNGEAELPVTDLDDINTYYDNLARPRVMTGTTASRHSDINSILGMAEGEGRRV